MTRHLTCQGTPTSPGPITARLRLFPLLGVDVLGQCPDLLGHQVVDVCLRVPVPRPFDAIRPHHDRPLTRQSLSSFRPSCASGAEETGLAPAAFHSWRSVGCAGGFRAVAGLGGTVGTVGRPC